MARVQLFLSTVSDEFRSYRDRLRHLLTRPDVEVKVQEDFIVTGDETLEMLDTYIQGCDGVIHLVGDMTGAMAKPQSVAAIAQRYPELVNRLPLAEFLQPEGPSLSYTQWEAWLALHHGKPLFIATPAPEAPRDQKHVREPDQQELQQAHLSRLRSVARYPGTVFSGQEHLAAEVSVSFVLDLLVEAGLTRRPQTLPFRSIGSLFKGRAHLMEQLEAATRPVALIGLGGVGKTRLAIEHAWRQVARRAAVLLVSADSAEALNRNLAGLCNPSALDLPEQTLTEEAAQRQAVLHWLQAHPGWLLILDSVETEEVAAAVETLLPQLNGGQLVITTRLSNWSAAVQGLEVEELEPVDAREFLLERTAARRRKTDHDTTTAEAIAVDDLGRLALALEQAGAYISERRLSLEAYRNKWQRNREAVLRWLDPRLMQYDQSLATTWLISYLQVDPPARTLLRRLAWFSPEPIPETLLEVEVPGDPQAAPGVREALRQLEAYSLVAISSEAPFFSLHRLVQEVARLWQEQSEQPEPNELQTALGWLDAAFVGDPQDVRSWPVLEPLEPHAKALVGFADAQGIAEPTARLMGVLGLLHLSQAAYGEAEPLMTRALAIDELNYGPNHPTVALRLNNLAGLLLQGTNRRKEAESMFCRAIAIDEANYGPSHSTVARDLSNLAQLFQDDNRLAEAEPLMRRALAIDELQQGKNHPIVAQRLNNLGHLLWVTDRAEEAELLMWRSLEIDEMNFGLNDPSVAIRLNNLMALLQASQRLQEAESLGRRALAINLANYGTRHPNVALCLNNLALLLKKTNRLEEAEPLMRQNVEILVACSSQGFRNPNLEIGITNYISLLQSMGLPQPKIKARLQSLQPASPSP